jgi:hypothetical protein
MPICVCHALVESIDSKFIFQDEIPMFDLVG